MKNRTVIISGGTDGIGKATVLRLLLDGFFVATFSRSTEKCESLRKEILKKFPSKKFLVVVGDVTNEESLSNVVKRTFSKFKSVDILINNAGIGYYVECDKVEKSKYEDLIKINIIGTVLLTKLVVPYMKKKKSGLIINIASISGKSAFARGEFYSSTKYAIMGYSEGIRKELGPFGIKVSTVCPGMTKTSFFKKSELKRRKKLWGGKIPQFLNVEDISRIIRFICTQPEHCDIQDINVMPFPFDHSILNKSNNIK